MKFETNALIDCALFTSSPTASFPSRPQVLVLPAPSQQRQDEIPTGYRVQPARVNSN
jgi:hypothetical protein